MLYGHCVAALIAPGPWARLSAAGLRVNAVIKHRRESRLPPDRLLARHSSVIARQMKLTSRVIGMRG